MDIEADHSRIMIDDIVEGRNVINLCNSYCVIIDKRQAQIRESHLKTLLSICETAQSNNDPGTIKNIATQIKNEPLHSDKVLAFIMKKCLSAAFGVEIVKVDSEGLIKSIKE